MGILKPPAGKTGRPAAWILLPGAQIDKSTYQPLAAAVQAKASMPLWVAVLGTYLTPAPMGFVPARLVELQEDQIQTVSPVGVLVAAYVNFVHRVALASSSLL